MQSLLRPFSFYGRASRSEYWLAAAISVALPIVSFLLIAAALFTVTRLLHGDPLQVVINASDTLHTLSEEQKALVGRQLGLDAPFALQYLRWTNHVFFRGNFGEWMTTGKPPTLLEVEDEFISNRNLPAENASLVAQYILIGIWLVVTLLVLVFWCAAVVRRLHDVRASEWHLVWFFIPGVNLVAVPILGAQNGDKFRD